MYIQLIATICLSSFACCAPYKSYKLNRTEYNFDQYDEIYDQRQNGTENYRVNVNGVVLVWSPPGALIQAASLLDPQLFEGEYPDVGELLSNTHEKPEDLIIIRPDKPTVAPPKVTEKPASVEITSAENEISPKEYFKRKPLFPGFMRPFVNRKYRTS